MANTKPTVVPEWARTTGHLTAPTSGKQDLGWEYEEDPSSSIENWRTKAVGQWLAWINERLNDGASSDDFEIVHPGTGKALVLFSSREMKLLANVGGGTSNGASLKWNIPDRSALAAATWNMYQYQDTLRLASNAGGGGLEHVYWLITHHATDPTMSFDDDLILQPATDGNGSFGQDLIRWDSVYTNKLYETDAPYLWANQQGGSIVISHNTWTTITPDSNIIAQGLTVEATAGRLEANSGHEGMYKVDCVFVIECSVANTDVHIQVNRNGTKVPSSTMITEILNGLGENNTISYSFLANLTAATDYLEIKLWFSQLGHTVTIKDTSHLTAVRCRKVKV